MMMMYDDPKQVCTYKVWLLYHFQSLSFGGYHELCDVMMASFCWFSCLLSG